MCVICDHSYHNIYSQTIYNDSASIMHHGTDKLCIRTRKVKKYVQGSTNHCLLNMSAGPNVILASCLHALCHMVCIITVKRSLWCMTVTDCLIKDGTDE